MVRKRTRGTKNRKNARKIYDSDENDSDDVDFSSPPSSPAPKRYGLRQRKQPIFCVDYDYEDDEEFNANKSRSDDDEYDVNGDLLVAGENNVGRSVRKSPRQNNSTPDASDNTEEPQFDEGLMDDGLIDFEDVIRADVVVNKQRMDYDNIINKTEIQLDPNPQPVREKGRRGRKPKPKPEPEIEYSVNHLEDTNSLQDSPPDDDTNVEVQIDPTTFVQSDSEENDISKRNGNTLEEDPETKNEQNKSPESPVENGKVEAVPPGGEIIEKYVPPELDEKEKEIVLSNEYLLANSFDITADEFLERQAQQENEKEEPEEPVPSLNFNFDSDSSDDVVIIEKKPEIIVLDDD